MGTELTVSIVVPVLNGAATIGDALTALLNQRGAPRGTELIVVDNGSADGTPEIVRRHNAILLFEPRRGASAARNRGLTHAQGEVVAFVDADTLPTRRWLAELVAPFADPGVLVVGGRNLDYMPRTPAQRFMAQMGTFKLEYNLARRVFPFIGSCNIAVRRGAALEINGWDETLVTAEDLDFCVRLVRRFACPLLRAPNAVLFNRHRSTDDALWRQAWGYGVGMGLAQRRYPEIIRLNFARWLGVAWVLNERWWESLILTAARRAGLGSEARAEFARYHWYWSRWFWGGFVSAIRNKADNS